MALFTTREFHTRKALHWPASAVSTKATQLGQPDRIEVMYAQNAPMPTQVRLRRHREHVRITLALWRRWRGGVGRWLPHRADSPRIWVSSPSLRRSGSSGGSEGAIAHGCPYPFERDEVRASIAGIAYPPSCSIRWGRDERRPITRHAFADGAWNADFESAFFPRNLPFIPSGWPRRDTPANRQSW
jgi:hypothetical protein